MGDMFYAPAVTPERLYIQDDRRRRWDNHERAVSSSLARNRKYWADHISSLMERGHSVRKIAVMCGVSEDWILRHVDYTQYRRVMKIFGRKETPAEIFEEQTMWYPGVYRGRDGDYGQIARDIPAEELVRLVQQRAKEDGEWAIENGFVGDNEDVMRKMIAWVSRPENIEQCAAAHFDHAVTVDFICRDLANGSKWVGGTRD